MKSSACRSRSARGCPAPLDGEGENGAWPLGSSYAMHVWLATVTVGEARPIAEHDQVRWVTKADLYDVPWLPDDLPVVRAVEALMVATD